MDAKSLYIIRKETGICLYHKDFTYPLFDPHLISSFIAAMASFFKKSDHSIGSSAKAFEGTDYKILVEFGKWVVGALVVSEDRAGLREKLIRIVQQFEEQFSVLQYVDMDLAVYTRFEPVVMAEFILDQITPDTIIRKRLNWEMMTKNPDVRSFLQVLPEKCTIEESAEFLEIPTEMAMRLAAEAVWDKAVTITQPVKPDDIYQATSLANPNVIEDVSPDAAKLVFELDGETTIAIAADRIKTTDLKKLLEEIALLEKRRKVEKVPPAQSTLVLQSSVLQSLMDLTSSVIGIERSRELFFAAKEKLLGVYPWLAFVNLEEGVDVEIRSSLLSAAVKGSLSPTMVYEGFRALLQFITKQISDYTGTIPLRKIIHSVKEIIEKQFPNRSYEVPWEQITIY